jgi:hypothetical protein
MADRKGEHKPSIVDGNLERVSPSQISSFGLCGLKWWFDKVKHLPRKPPGKGQQLGDKCHKEIEHFLRTGEDVRGPLPRSGDFMLEPYLERAPFKGGDLGVEHPLAPLCRWCEGVKAPEGAEPCSHCGGSGHGPWTVRTPGGIEVVGYMDLVVPDKTLPHVIDHKFKKDLERYAVGEAELREDPQAVIYSEFCRRHFSPKEGTRFSHHNHQTQGRRYAYPTSIVMGLTEIEEKWLRMAQTIDGPMRATARLTSADQVERNEQACGAFGGCDYATVCPYSPANKFARSLLQDDETEGNTQMGLLDAVKNNPSPATAPATPPAAAPAAPAASPASSAPVVASGLTAAHATAGKLYKAADGRTGTFSVSAGGKSYFMGADGAAFALDDTAPVTEAAPAPAALPAGAIYAKDASQRGLYVVRDTQTVFLCMTNGKCSFLPVAGGQPILVEQGEPVIPVTSTSAPATAPAPVAPPPAAPSAPATSAPVGVLPPDAAKASHTAPPATPNETEEDGDEELDEPNAALAAQADAPKRRGRKPKAETAATAPASSPNALAGLVLLVDAVPLGTMPSRDLAPYVAEIAAKLGESVPMRDVRLAPKDSPLAFGGWKGAIAQAVRQNPPSGLCYIARGELADAAIEALIPLASIVVRPLA